MEKLLKLDIKTLFFLVIIAILLFKQCGPSNDEGPTETIDINGKTHIVVKKETDTLIVEKKTVINKPGKDIYHDTIIYVPVPQDVDTSKILSQYYAKNVYKDTLKLDDSLGIVSLVDTIKENKIHHRTFKANVKEKVINNTIYVQEPPKRQLYAGTYVGINNTEVLKTLNVGLLYKDKKDKIFHLGAGVINQTPNNLSPVINGGVFWKIRVKK